MTYQEKIEYELGKLGYKGVKIKSYFRVVVSVNCYDVHYLLNGERGVYNSLKIQFNDIRRHEKNFFVVQ